MQQRWIRSISLIFCVCRVGSLGEFLSEHLGSGKILMYLGGRWRKREKPQGKRVNLHLFLTTGEPMTLNQTQLVAKKKNQSFKFQTENHSMIFIITYHLRGTNLVFSIIIKIYY